MEAIWWLFGLAVLMGGLVLLSQSQHKPDTPHSPDDMLNNDHLIKEIARGITVTTSLSSREYDPNAYRIDGIAQPEYRITYADADGSITEREIYIDTWYENSGTTFYKCWCFLKDEQRTFRQDRIQRTINLRTNRSIKNIAEHRMRY